MVSYGGDGKPYPASALCAASTGYVASGPGSSCTCSSITDGVDVGGLRRGGVLAAGEATPSRLAGSARAIVDGGLWRKEAAAVAVKD